MQAFGAFPFDNAHGVLRDIPESVRRKDGKRVTIEGWMIPMDQADRITEFAVVPELGEGSPPPPIQQIVIVKMPSGTWTPYYVEQVAVQGVLHVGVETDQGFSASQPIQWYLFWLIILRAGRTSPSAWLCRRW